jgi:ADP-ribose pyrophosphatase YjhB (NUDIX family)
MARSSKLIAVKRGKVLLVRRKRDRLWTFPGGRKRAGETELECLRREIGEELPKLNLRRLKLWRTVTARRTGSRGRMSDAVFFAGRTSGDLTIGDKRELDRAIWRKPKGIRLTPTSRYIRDEFLRSKG